MRRIGLIGGMSWESTAVYYRHINTMMRARKGGLHSADLLLHSLDFARVAAHQTAGDWDAAAALLADAAEWLLRGGAEGVLICSNTMHLVAGPVAARIAAVRPQARLIDVIDEIAQALHARQRRRPLLLATRYTMEHGFYTDRMREADIDVVIPDAADRQALHDVIFDELCQGVVSEASRDRVMAIIDRGIAAGADSVILGCTEICLLLDPDELPCPGFDSTAIHARAAVAFALDDGLASRQAA